MCIPSDRTFPIISKISSSRELHKLAEIMGPVSVGEQRLVLLCRTWGLCVSQGHSQVLHCVQTSSHIAAGTHTAYHMLREVGSNLLYSSCQKPL